MMKVLAAAVLAAASVGFAAPASASPTCYDPLLCQDPGGVYFCPDTGQFVSVYGSCPSMVTGPYQPGGLQPGGGIGR